MTRRKKTVGHDEPKPLLADLQLVKALEGIMRDCSDWDRATLAKNPGENTKYADQIDALTDLIRALVPHHRITDHRITENHVDEIALGPKYDELLAKFYSLHISVETETEPETKPKTKLETKPESKPETKSEIEPETKPKSKNAKRKLDINKLLADWNEYIGDGDLADWQRLCVHLGLPGDLPSKTKCRNEIKSVHVNIRQFLDAPRKPEDVKFFKNVWKLSNWTIRHNLIVRNDLVERGTPMRALMRELSRY